MLGLVLAGIGAHGLHAAPPFAKGADISWLPQMEAAGIRFLDASGAPGDLIAILQGYAMDTVRLRVFVNPSEDPVDGHCGRDAVVALAARAHKAGMRVMINFHYSDSWADPKKQTKPKAWETLEFPGLLAALEAHTLDVLQALRKAGVEPEWIQVGNEIPGGMLWPEGSYKNFGQLAALINRGHDAAKSVFPSAKVIVHIDRGQDAGLSRWFFGKLREHGARFDVIGLSYYPHWAGSDYRETIEALGSNLVDLTENFDKDVMIVEVGGHFEEPENTRSMLEAVLARTRSVPGGRGLGVLYWEPQGTRSFSRGYSLGAWNEDGTPNGALEAFRQNAPLP